jgi:dihydrolipoamide dehydrogenase
MTPAKSYDLVVVGSGTGGYVAAIRAAQLGLKTAVVEREPVLGGTCLNWGCIPTKAWLEHAHAFRLARQAAEWGISFGPAAEPIVDFSRILARKNQIVSGLTRGIDFLFRKNGVEWIKGTARLAAPGTLEVTNGTDPARTVSASEIVLATGSAPRSIPGVVIDKRQIVTSDDAIDAPAAPGTLAILGSGAVGVEFASIFRQFGSEVTLIELHPRIVPNEDAAVSAELARAFKRRGIRVRTDVEVQSAVAADAGVTIEMRDAVGTNHTLVVDQLLVATGRVPVTKCLGANEAGLNLQHGFIVVDEPYRTNVAGVSAIGDVITINGAPHPQLAHLSSAEGVLVAERIAGRAAAAINYDQVPASTYCEPEIGSVGLTEAAARTRGYDVRIGTFPFSALGRARIAGDTEGFVKIVAEARYDQVLGVHIIGARATELVAEASLALRLEATVEEFVRTIHAHPTLSEAIGEAAHAAHGHAIHI